MITCIGKSHRTRNTQTRQSSLTSQSRNREYGRDKNRHGTKRLVI